MGFLKRFVCGFVRLLSSKYSFMSLDKAYVGHAVFFVFIAMKKRFSNTLGGT